MFQKGFIQKGKEGNMQIALLLCGGGVMGVLPQVGSLRLLLVASVDPEGL